MFGGEGAVTDSVSFYIAMSLMYGASGSEECIATKHIRYGVEIRGIQHGDNQNPWKRIKNNSSGSEKLKHTII
ncbi:hypothetical protein ACH3XW_2270 [Acanthocheilonema viteae]